MSQLFFNHWFAFQKPNGKSDGDLWPILRFKWNHLHLNRGVHVMYPDFQSPKQKISSEGAVVFF